MHEGVHHGLAKRALVEEHDLLALHHAIALISLGNVEQLAVLKRLVKRVEQACVAKLAHGIHRRRLVRSVEHGEAHRDVAVIAQELRQQVVSAVFTEQTQVLLKRAARELHAFGRVVHKQLVKREVLIIRRRVHHRGRAHTQGIEELRLTFGVFCQVDLARPYAQIAHAIKACGHLGGRRHSKQHHAPAIKFKLVEAKTHVGRHLSS